MEVAKAYILEDNPQILSIDSSIDSNFSSELNLRGSYIFGENVTNFIHHQYSKYWDRGIPVIHIADEIIPLEDGGVSSLKKSLSLFLPFHISVDKKREVMDTIKQLQDTYNFINKNIYYIKDKQDFGYDYECYPPYLPRISIPFSKVVDIFLRDATNTSTEEEKVMFHKFRDFDLKSVLLDEDIYKYPINHEQCGVVIVGEKEYLEATVTKRFHEDEIMYQLSKLFHKDLTLDDFSCFDAVSEHNFVIAFIRSQSIDAVFPTQVNSYQYNVLSNISNCLDAIYREDGILISQNIAKVLPSGKVIDNGLLSFREMADECYQRFLIGEGERVGEEQKKTPTK